MKKIFVLLIAFASTIIIANAQCEGTTKWTASKLKFIDSSGNTIEEKEQQVTVQSNNKIISVIVANSTDSMDGTVSAYTCNWPEAGKNGKTVLKGQLTDQGGKLRHATITIEAVNGKITILMEAEEESSKILLQVDSYEAVK